VTRSYAERAEVLASQLRTEIAMVPRIPHGRPALVVIMGLPGVGKSHCARLLCERIGGAHVASDEVRSRLFIAATYADAENRAIFAAVSALVDSLLGEGHRVVVDATNLLARNRAATVAAARRRDLPVIYIRVSSSDEAARARLAKRRVARAAGDHSDADVQIYERMRLTFEPPDEGFLELLNEGDLTPGLDRVVRAIESATG
jgi:hypothetical protein